MTMMTTLMIRIAGNGKANKLSTADDVVIGVNLVM